MHDTYCSCTCTHIKSHNIQMSQTGNGEGHVNYSVPCLKLICIFVSFVYTCTCTCSCNQLHVLYSTTVQYNTSNKGSLYIWNGDTIFKDSIYFYWEQDVHCFQDTITLYQYSVQIHVGSLVCQILCYIHVLYCTVYIHCIKQGLEIGGPNLWWNIHVVSKC